MVNEREKFVKILEIFYKFTQFCEILKFLRVEILNLKLNRKFICFMDAFKA